MTKKLLITVLAVIIGCMCLFTACGGTEDAGGETTDTSYTVTVTNGTGGGEYDANAEATVTATVPDYKEFTRWIDGDGNQASTSNPYTFTVTEDISLTAEFTDIAYTVSVSGGTANATSYKYGDNATVTALVGDDYSFVKWIDGNNNEVSTSATYSFTVSEDISLVAVMEYSKVIAGKAVIMVNNGTTSAGLSYVEVDENSSVTVVPVVPTGSAFIEWQDASGTVLSSESTYTFTATENITLVAVMRTITTYTFEGESVDLTGITTQGPSNQYDEYGLIDSASKQGIVGYVSNDYFLANVHSAGVEFDFVINSDIAATGATVTLRLASELGKSVFLESDVFGVSVNGTELDYTGFTLTGATTWGYSGVSFTDFEIDVPFDLVKGENTITLSIKANEFTSGTSIMDKTGGGPGIDCIYVTSYADLELDYDYWQDYKLVI